MAVRVPEKVSKHFGGVKTVGIIGDNGAGKSTRERTYSSGVCPKRAVKQTSVDEIVGFIVGSKKEE
jgi:ABC-type polysaccharide/polyol phosphate transport system ATPase subunit